MNSKMEGWLLKAVADMERRVLAGENMSFIERMKPYTQLWNYQMWKLAEVIEKHNNREEDSSKT